MKPRSKFLLTMSLTLLLFCINSYAGYAQQPAPTPGATSRQESESAIRTAVYESALAACTGDVKLYRRHVARRTLELNRLVFEGLRELPDFNEMFTENNIDTADKFLDMTFVQGASQYANLSREEKEQKARAQSNGSLTFLNEKEVILQFGGSTMRIVFEDKEWKIDETESSKPLFLKNFPFTAETRARIEKL